MAAAGAADGDASRAKVAPPARLGTLKQLELLEGPVITAVKGAFVADQQGETSLLVGDPLKNPGQALG